MNVAIILSGGIGSRMGGNIPKQYVEINGYPIIYYCLKTFICNKDIDFVIIVLAEEWRHYVEMIVKNLKPRIPIYYALSGETRQYSIFNGLIVAKDNGTKDEDVVIIHDAARPMVSAELISACLANCRVADGVLPVIPVKDTIYFSDDGRSITNLLDRNKLFAGQAPEAFLFGKYLHLHQDMPHDELVRINGSTEIAYKGGLNIKLIKGDVMNFKITTPEDMSNFESIIKVNESICFTSGERTEI